MKPNSASVYICVLPKELPDGTEARLLDGLPGYRREKAEKYVRNCDRVLSAAAWRLMRYAVRDAFGLDGFALEVRFDGVRKPYFAVETGFHFNVSHCQGAAACAVSTRPCGVDIEPLRAADCDVALRFMPSGDYGALMRMPDGETRDDFYTRSWTEAESVFKSGLLPESRRVSRFRRDIYYIAVCAEARSGGVRLNDIGFDKLI